MDEIIASLSTSGWIHVENFLGQEQLSRMNEYFEERRGEFRAALIGKGEAKQRMTEVRGDHTHWLDTLNPPGPFTGALAFLEGLKQELNRSLYLGLKEFECHLAYYGPGAFYKKHLDRFEADSSRAVSFIFYLHERWGREDGGELVLYDGHGKVIHEVRPLPGSFVCFLSSEFPHEVKVSHRERRSLTGWMHTKIIN